MEIDSLQKLYVDELKDLYSAEKQILQALPRMAKKVSSPELRRAFEEHIEVTKGQVERLDQIFERLGDQGVRGVERDHALAQRRRHFGIAERQLADAD